ncbi:MAG: tol-pal system protein YbgF [Parvularculaceae bacterium]
MRSRTGFFAIIALVALTAPAMAGTKEDIRDLQARIAQLEQSLAGQAQANVRIAALEEQNQRLTGEVEQLTYRLDMANQRLEAISAALAGDASYVPGQAGAATGGPVNLAGAAGDVSHDTTDATGSVGGGDVALPLDPNAAFDYASNFLLAGDYKRARDAFTLYVEAFPNHPKTPDAQFRLGEIHLALGENAAAADTFIAYIRKYPNDPRTAEAYLKLGTSFARLEKNTEACTVFKSMKSKYPNAPSAVVQRADLEMARIKCK